MGCWTPCLLSALWVAVSGFTLDGPTSDLSVLDQGVLQHALRHYGLPTEERQYPTGALVRHEVAPENLEEVRSHDPSSPTSPTEATSLTDATSNMATTTHPAVATTTHAAVSYTGQVVKFPLTSVSGSLILDWSCQTNKCTLLNINTLRAAIVFAIQAVTGMDYAQTDVGTILVDGCSSIFEVSAGGAADRVLFSMNPMNVANAVSLAMSMGNLGAEFRNKLEAYLEGQLDQCIALKSVGEARVKTISSGWAELIGSLVMDFPDSTLFCSATMNAAYTQAVAGMISSVSGLTIPKTSVMKATMKACESGAAANMKGPTKGQVLLYKVKIVSPQEASQAVSMLSRETHSLPSFFAAQIMEESAVKVSNVLASVPTLRFVADAV